MRLEWIEDILAVNDTGSFNSAAETRFLTPSAFTRRIRAIEGALGCELFDRSTRPITLRNHVVDCIPELRDAAAAIKRAKSLLSDPDLSHRLRVTLICQHALAASIAPKLLSNFAAGNRTHVRVKSGRMSQCILSLVQRDAEFALVYQPVEEELSIVPDNCEQVSLGQEIFLPVGKPGVFSASEEDEIPIVGYPKNIFLGEIQQRMFRDSFQSTRPLTTVAETGLSLAVVEFVRRGLGVGWLPKSIVTQDIVNGNLIDLSERLPSFTLSIVLLRLEGPMSSSSEDFWNNAKVGTDNSYRHEGYT